MSSLPRAGAALFAALLAAASFAGCDTDDGRALQEPKPGATAPPLATETTATTAAAANPPVGSGDVEAFVLASPSFADGTAIPAAHSSCDGADVSPGLEWQGVPAGTVDLAITVVDPDAPSEPFVHWVVTGIDPVTTGFAEGGLPETATAVQPWTGPCPPRGETHNYVFTIYALTEPIEETDDVDAVLAELESTAGPVATLVGTYGRPTT